MSVKPLRLNVSYPLHRENLLGSVNSFFKQDAYMDLIFICRDNTSVSAHKMVLSAVSTFLKDMIACNVDDPLYVSIPDVSPSKMKLLLSFLYGGGTQVNKEELAAIRSILTLLEIRLPSAVVMSLDSAAASQLEKLKVEKPDPPNITDNVADTSSTRSAGQSSQNITFGNKDGASINTGDITIKEEPQDVICIDSDNDNDNEEDYSFAAAAVEVTYAPPPEENTGKRLNTSTEIPNKVEPPLKKAKSDSSNSNSPCSTPTFVRKRLSIPPARYADTDMNLPSTRPRRTSEQKQTKNEVENTGPRIESVSSGVQFQTEENAFSEVSSDNKSKPSWKIQLSAPSKIASEGVSTASEEMQSDPFENTVKKTQPVSATKGKSNNKSKSNKSSACDRASIAEDSVDSFEASETFPLEGVTVKSESEDTMGTEDTMETEDTLGTEYPDSEHGTEEESLSERIIPTWKNGKPVRELTDKQHSRLEREYMMCRFPNSSKITQLAYGLGLKVAKVKMWFANQRLKDEETRKKLKTHFTSQQIQMLEQEFQQNEQLPSSERQRELANELGVSPLRIMSWFYNRRRRGVVTKRVQPLQFSEEQKDFLEKKFIANPFCLKDDLKDISTQMGVSVYRVATWFQEQRRLRNIKWAGRKQILPLTEDQKAALQAEFQANPFPGQLRRQELAGDLDLSANRVKVWFIQEQTANGLKRKIGRQVLEFTEDQLNTLECEYHNNQYPSVKVQEQLAEALGVHVYRITRWFVKKREEDGLSKKEKFQFSEDQINILKTDYEVNPYPDVERQKQLATELGVLVYRITKWFVDKREEDGLDKKERFQLSDDQKTFLEGEYQYYRYPDAQKQNEIAAQLRIPMYRVTKWFLERREADGLSKKEKFQFTEEQIQILEKSYALNPFPEVKKQKKLATQFGCLTYRITRFFVDKREADGLNRYKKFQFTDEQIQVLEKEYEVNQFPGSIRQKEIAAEFDVNVHRITSWFSNKREINGLTNRKMVVLSQEQEDILEKEYQTNQYPDIQRMDQLASELGVHADRITRWFLKKRQVLGLKCEKTRPKVQLSEDQEALLEKEYEMNNNPDLEKQKEFATSLDVPVFYITRWFLNKRQMDGLNSENSSPSFQFSADEIGLLKKEYSINKYPDVKRYEELAAEIGVATYRVSTWFTVKRRLEGDTSRAKIQFNDDQIIILEKEYEENNCPDLERQEEIAAELNVPTYRVSTWFLNKRREQGIKYSYPESRWQFTEEERNYLEREYELDQYPEQEKMEQIASELGLSVIRISRWFWNRRQKHGLNYKDESKRKIQLAPEHWKTLEEEFQIDQFPDADKLKQLGKSFGIPVSRVTQWFQNKRNEMHIKNSKKKYLPLTFEQQDRLEEEYQKNRNPDLAKQKELATELGVPICRISVWFMRHRRSDKFNSSNADPLNDSSFSGNDNSYQLNDNDSSAGDNSFSFPSSTCW